MAEISDSDDDQLNTAKSPQNHGFGKPMTPEENGINMRFIYQKYGLFRSQFWQ